MKHLTLRQQAYAKIKEMLVTGQFPAGSALSETKLAKDLGMSRTPIREAIRQMEMEGIVEYSPRFSVVVKTASEDMLREMFSVREALETHAAAEATQSVSATDIAELERLLTSMETIASRFENSGDKYLPEKDLHEFTSADMAFHEAIVKASGNQYLRKLVRDTKLLVRIFTSSYWKYDLEALQEANDFHRRLLEAIVAGDPEQARAITRESMQVAKANTIEQIDALDNDPEPLAI